MIRGADDARWRGGAAALAGPMMRRGINVRLFERGAA
jgi:hypothetical protein